MKKLIVQFELRKSKVHLQTHKNVIVIDIIIICCCKQKISIIFMFSFL